MLLVDMLPLCSMLDCNSFSMFFWIFFHSHFSSICSFFAFSLSPEHEYESRRWSQVVFTSLFSFRGPRTIIHFHSILSLQFSFWTLYIPVWYDYLGIIVVTSFSYVVFLFFVHILSVCWFFCFFFSTLCFSSSGRLLTVVFVILLFIPSDFEMISFSFSSFHTLVAR